MPFAFGAQRGSIQIRGQQLSVREGSKVLIQNFGDRAFGDIQIDINDAIELSESNITDTRGNRIATTNFGQGIGGNINLSAQQLRLVGGVDIGTDTFGSASSGNVVIAVSDAVRIDPNNSALSDFGNIQTVSYRSGTAGNIKVSTGELAIAGDGISSRTIGAGQGGTVRVLANSVALMNGGNISSATLGAGAGGDVTVSTDTIEVSGVAPFSFLPSIIAQQTDVQGSGIHQTAIDGLSLIAYQVGYESPSQFSREYARMFGAPPIKDIENLRTA